ncbi:HSPB1-associated protein 1 homolog [Anopheles cruzii]|uniref:HSPB1-associated protein 1 homolog n=1 Tax=Anopheles cruzii TaxID=68878 RepID=UPI0022EC45BF|nr:HSPB1-associated protein 1 homolog [Anopheles cruzii]
MDPNKLRDIVLNAEFPHVVLNVAVPWDCFELTFEEWCAKYDSARKELVAFEGCSVKAGRRPQWERARTEMKMSMSDICKSQPDTAGRWNSFSYRNISELPAVCRSGINFACFGFPSVDEDISFWIGSPNAHTPCHYDTYGCNIVVQVFGKKSWILFPPETKLTPVRVPFEESSVYCEENFYSPLSYGDLTGVENQAYHVVLEPGMALIVPPRWWHYVETLEPSLNFNTWLPLQNDTEALLSECITKILIQDICQDLQLSVKKHVFNPNEDSISGDEGLKKSFAILDYLTHQKKYNKHLRADRKRYSAGYLSSEAMSTLLEDSKAFVRPVSRLENCSFFQMMKHNHLRYDASIDRRFEESLHKREAEQLTSVCRKINCCCNPAVVQLIKEALLR